MARYFFNIRHGPGPDGLALDPDGDDLADAEAARAHALAVARDLITRTHLDSVRDWFACTFEITDAQGRAVMQVPFTETTPNPDDDTGSG